MRNATRIIASLLFALAVITFAPAESRADDACFNKSDRIVTPEEYAQLEPGMLLSEVKVIVGASGTPMDPPYIRVVVDERSFKVCARTGSVLMTFYPVRGRGLVLDRTQVHWS